MKRRVIAVTIILVIAGIITFLVFKKNSFDEKYKHYDYPYPAIFEELHLNYLAQNSNMKFKSSDFKEFLDSDSLKTTYLGIWHRLNYNVVSRNDSIFIYDFGFDDKDDHFTSAYFPADISFINSIYVKGDVLLYKNKIVFQKPKRSKIVNFLGDSIPPIPIPIPQRVLDSIKDMDSIKRREFIHNYGKKKEND